MKKYIVGASDFAIINDMMWFVTLEYRYLCCYDLQQRKIVEQLIIPISNRSIALFESICKYKESIIFIPSRADYILIFDLIEWKFEEIPIMSFEQRGGGFYANCIYGGVLYLFPRFVKNMEIEHYVIGKLKLETKEIEYDFIKHNKNVDLINKIVFRMDTISDLEHLFLLESEGKILKCNLSANTQIMNNITEMNIGKKVTTIVKMSDNVFCMADELGNIVCYDYKNKEIECVENKVENFNIYYKKSWRCECFGHCIKYKNFIYFFPSDANKVLQFNAENKRLEEAVFSKIICVNKKMEKKRWGQFSKPYIIKDKLYVWNTWSGFFYIIDISTNEIEQIAIELQIEKKELLDSFTRMQKDGRYEESTLPFGNLDTMLTSINDESDFKQENAENFSGKDVWYEIKNKSTTKREI